MEAPDLEFPDWNGMRDSLKLVDAEAAFLLSERCAAIFPEAAGNRRSRSQEKCPVEFVL
jgi:hypothetical protein